MNQNKHLGDARYKKLLALLTQVLGDASSAVVHWANDLATSTNLHQWVSGISGANGAGGVVAVRDQATLQQTQAAGTGVGDGNVLVRQVPFPAGRAPWSWTFATETFGAGPPFGPTQLTPAMSLGYNCEGEPGNPRMQLTMEQGFATNGDGTGPIDNEIHLQFFDTAGVRGARPFTSSYYAVDGSCSVGAFFREGDGTPGGGGHGSWLVGDQTSGQTLIGAASVNANQTGGGGVQLRAFGYLGWAYTVQNPIITQDDNVASADAEDLSLLPQRSTFLHGDSGNLLLGYRAAQAGGVEGLALFQREGVTYLAASGVGGVALLDANTSGNSLAVEGVTISLTAVASFLALSAGGGQPIRADAASHVWRSAAGVSSLVLIPGTSLAPATNGGLLLGVTGKQWAQVQTQSLVINATNISTGAGNPNGAVVGSPGDLYLNTAGGAGTTLWVKESGAATNTGWVGK